MTNHVAAFLALTAASLLPACTGGVTGPVEGEGTPSLSFACPTPSDARIESPYALSGQDLLASSDYITLMINHGSMENLEALLSLASTEPLSGVVKPSDLERVIAAIAFRHTNNCPDVPFYSPYLTDVPVDYLDPNLMQ